MISGDRSVLSGKKGAFWQTLEEFHKHWDRIDVVCPRASSEFRIPSSEFFGNVHFHPSPWSLWRQPEWISKKGSELIAAHRHDVMTVHEYPPFYNGIGALSLRKKHQIPTCVEVHHIVGVPRAASLTEWIGRMMSRYWLPVIGRHVESVRIVNEDVGTKLSSWGVPSEKLTLVPSFYLDTELFYPEPLASKRYDVVFCARLVANKGLDRTLKAIARVPKATLLVVGEGPERARAQRLAAKLGIRTHVTFAGWANDASALADYLRSAKVFVMASKSEGGPRILLEAMACGIPPVATRVGIAPSVIQHQQNGLLSSDDPRELADAILSLLSDEDERNRMGEAASNVRDTYEKASAIRAYATSLQSLA